MRCERAGSLRAASRATNALSYLADWPDQVRRIDTESCRKWAQRLERDGLLRALDGADIRAVHFELVSEVLLREPAFETNSMYVHREAAEESRSQWIRSRQPHRGCGAQKPRHHDARLIAAQQRLAPGSDLDRLKPVEDDLDEIARQPIVQANLDRQQRSAQDGPHQNIAD